MSVLDQHQSGVRALVRCGRHGRNAVEWEEPCVHELYLQHDNKGRAAILALAGRGDFAEFDPRQDHEEPMLLVAEDYALEILEIPAKQAQLDL